MDVQSGDSNAEPLAAHLLARRKELRLGQAEAARRAGVGRMAWYEWETGRRAPRDYNHAGIDTAMRWESGGVEAIIAGGEPTPIPDDPPPLTAQQERLLDVYRTDYLPNHGKKRALELLQQDVNAINAAIEREQRDAG